MKPQGPGAILWLASSASNICSFTFHVTKQCNTCCKRPMPGVSLGVGRQLLNHDSFFSPTSQLILVSWSPGVCLLDHNIPSLKLHWSSDNPLTSTMQLCPTKWPPWHVTVALVCTCQTHFVITDLFSMFQGLFLTRLLSVLCLAAVAFAWVTAAMSRRRKLHSSTCPAASIYSSCTIQECQHPFWFISRSTEGVPPRTKIVVILSCYLMSFLYESYDRVRGAVGSQKNPKRQQPKSTSFYSHGHCLFHLNDHGRGILTKATWSDDVAVHVLMPWRIGSASS